jgi:hypothetical protein
MTNDLARLNEAATLLPCPFCGGDAELREWDWPYVRFQCRCAKCKCQARARMADKAEAIAAWNTRPTPATGIAEAVDHVGANTLPTEYVRWLSSIEHDVRVHDLTADEVARLVDTVAKHGAAK